MHIFQIDLKLAYETQPASGRRERWVDRYKKSEVHNKLRFRYTPKKLT